MVPSRYREFFATLKTLVEAGEVPMARIDDAVPRILRVKSAMGLLDEAAAADPTLPQSFGSAEHRAVARRAVRESLVLLKNEGKTLPLSKKAKRIHVAGKSADDLGNQCGGWTITWQGKSGAPTQGTTILAALRQARSRTRKVTYSRGWPAPRAPTWRWSWSGRRRTRRSSATAPTSRWPGRPGRDRQRQEGRGARWSWCFSRAGR